MIYLRSQPSGILTADSLSREADGLALPAPQPPSARLAQVDLLRGIAMTLMALDHARHFFYVQTFAPTDLEYTSPLLFLTRWVTHFCAPIFVFLAGTGAFLSLGKYGKKATAWFLLTRGLVLIGLELFVVRFLWLGPDFDFHVIPVQVIWALGWSMVALAGLLFLPTWAVAGVGVVMIAGHNLCDRLDGPVTGPWSFLWALLHHPGQYEYMPGYSVLVWYPLIPWVGVMAAGYGLGWLLRREEHERRAWLLRLGLGLTAAFVILRTVNVYGDPQPWSRQGTGLFTVLSFLNVEKSPPSLLFVLMTLGPSIFFLAIAEHAGRGPLSDSLVTIGRVPLFFYLLHLPLLQVLHKSGALLTDRLPRLFADSAGWYDRHGLAVVYLVWLLVMILLFPFCHWLAEVKRRRRTVWLRYI
jgi:uncharacterized membrane protein